MEPFDVFANLWQFEHDYVYRLILSFSSDSASSIVVLLSSTEEFDTSSLYPCVLLVSSLLLMMDWTIDDVKVEAIEDDALAETFWMLCWQHGAGAVLHPVVNESETVGLFLWTLCWANDVVLYGEVTLVHVVVCYWLMKQLIMLTLNMEKVH